MSEEEGGFESTMRKIAEFEKKQTDAITKNTTEMSKMRETFQRISIGFGNVQQSNAMGIVSQQSYQKLVEQTKLLRDQLSALERVEKQFSKYNPKIDSGTGEERGTLSMIFKHLGERIGKAFEPITRILSPILKSVWNIGKSVWGGLKKAGLLPGVFAGIGIAVGAVIAKVIQSSPLLTAMMKMMNMGITLMLRPIGDFIGSVLRPMMIYFIKDVAVPFFQATKGLVKDGGKIGKGLLSFFIQPIETIGAAIVASLLKFPFFGSIADPTGHLKRSTDLMFSDPARVFREAKGIGEFKHTAGKGAGLFPSDTEWLNMGLKMPETRESQLEFYREQGMTEKQIEAKGRPASAAWIIEQRKEDPTMSEHYTTSAWKKLAKYREDIFKRFGTTEPFGNKNNPMGQVATINPGDVTTAGGGGEDLFKQFWDWLQTLGNSGDTASDSLDETTNSLDDFGVAWGDFIDYIGSGWDNFGKDIETWKTDIGQAWDKWVEQVSKDTKSWTEGASQSIAEGWEWITNFGKVNEAFADTGEDSKEANKTWIDSIWDWIESIKIGIFGTRVAVDGFADTIVTAGDKITTAADVATGGIFQGSGHGRPLAAGTGENPWNPIDAVIGAVTGKPSSVFSGVFGEPTTGGGLYSKPDDVGHSNLLGAFSDTRFESSPGKFVDIYSKGEKVDPNSAEGKTIQGIYQKQHDTKIANDKQQALMATVKKEVTSADAGKAYILAGGGEKGLAAVEMAKKEGLSMVHYADIVKLADALGLKDHPMIKTAREGLKAKIAMAKKIMAQRVAAGQTPSIQGDMLDLFPDAEDSEFGWSDERLAVQEAGYQETYAQLGSIGMIPAGMSLEGYQASLGIPGQYAQALGGFTTAATGWSGSSQKARTGGRGTTGGGQGAARSSRGTGKSSTGGSASKGTGGGKTGGGTGRRGSSGAGSGSSGGGTASGSKGTGKKGSAGKGRKGSQYGGIIDEPIIGVGIHTGEEYIFGESGRERITPIGTGDEYAGDIIINIGNISKEADYNKLKPLIQRWILEASARRGTV